MSQTPRKVDRPAAVVAIGLIAAAAVIAYDASQMRQTATYGIGPTAMPYVIACFLVLLGLAHGFVALRDGLPEPEDALDLVAVVWVLGGLVALMVSIAFGGGFILGITCLFAFTARAFGRRALIADLGFGAVLGIFVFLLFTHVLGLSLPSGPLERLI